MNEEIQLMVADADSTVRDIIRFCVKEEGWLIDEARDGIEAIKLLRRGQYQLIILEAELPIIDGYMVCEYVQKSPRTLIVFISRKGAEDNRLAAFDAGANDFLLKPFFPRELMARIKNLFAISNIAGKQVQFLSIGSLNINLHSHDVAVDDARIRLTPKEYNLLLFLCQNPNQAFSRDTLLDLVWGRQFDGTDRTVDTHVKSLREKIRPYEHYIATVWGFGYKFEIS